MRRRRDVVSVTSSVVVLYRDSVGTVEMITCLAVFSPFFKKNHVTCANFTALVSFFQKTLYHLEGFNPVY